MSLLEVIAIDVIDAKNAEAGGADRIELLGTMDCDGLSPTPEQVAQARKAVGLKIRPMVRLRDGFSTDAAEIAQLKQLIAAYLDTGADGLVLGFLNQRLEVDTDVVGELLAGIDAPVTFHRAIDHSADRSMAWQRITGFTNIDQVLTAGSAAGITDGLAELTGSAKADPKIAKLIMAGGGLKREHIPALVASGIRACHIGSPARPAGSFADHIAADLVSNWRKLLDEATSQAQQS